jgi:2-methylisocitrate lyase-like PEP mutase family enzyme
VTTTEQRRHRLAERVSTGPLLVAPGAANGLAARVIEETGFEAVYVTGAGIANSFLGVPDLGLVTLTELELHVAAIRDAVDLPLIVDADTGFGNPIGVARTVRTLARAGADAIQLEDQVSPKRCGHFDGKEVVSQAAMVKKIQAAVDARPDNRVLIIARTDAASVTSFDAAIDRARAYSAAGADATFVEAPRTKKEVLAIPGRVAGPSVVNLVEGGLTPLLPIAELGAFRIAVFANAALQGAIRGMQRVLEKLRETGSLATAADDLAPWDERQRLVRKAAFDGLEARYGTDDDDQ